MRLCETQPISCRQVYCTKSKGLFDLCGQAQPQTFWESEEIDRLMGFYTFCHAGTNNQVLLAIDNRLRYTYSFR